MHTVPTMKSVLEKILAGELTSLRTNAKDAHTIEVGNTVVFREAVRNYHWQLVEGGLAASVVVKKATVFDRRLTNETELEWEPATVRKGT